VKAAQKSHNYQKKVVKVVKVDLESDEDDLVTLKLRWKKGHWSLSQGGKKIKF